MNELQLKRVNKALGLKRQIVGFRFLVFQEDYTISKGQESTDLSLCQLIEEASKGNYVKAKGSESVCSSGLYAVGMKEVPEVVSTGRLDYENGNFESLSISRKVYENKQFIPQKIYGIECAPLEIMETADIVVFIGTSKDIMRIMQGYVRYYGIARNVIAIGQCGICSELISKPFMNNDLNVSLLSPCSRKKCNYSMGEMGIAMPLHMVENTLSGILETVNLTENNKPKQDILKRLNYPTELGFEIRMNYDYAIQSMEYQKYCEECRKQLNQ